MPVCSGKSLAELLHPDDPDFEWMPNDFYGHVHDELWYSMVLPAATNPLPVSQNQTNATPFPDIGTNAIPWLIQWLRTTPNGWDSAKEKMAEHLPARISQWLSPCPASWWKGRVGRWHIAACQGFALLRTNAEPALPALSNLLQGASVDLPLTLGIANIGPHGIDLLSTALMTTTNAEARENIALALGFCGEAARPAFPALVNCVQRSHATYHVLGAIGRIGGSHPALVPSLIRLLDSNPLPKGAELDESMAILVLGLQGRAAQPAIPTLLTRYRNLPQNALPSQRRLLRQSIRHVSPDSDAQLPAPTTDELSLTWP